MKRSLCIALLGLMAVLTSKPAGVINGTTTCPTSGTKQTYNSGISVFSYTVIANPSNAGNIYVGGQGVSSSNAFPLGPGSSVNFSQSAARITPSSVYFACSTNTDSIFYLALQ